MTDIVQKTTEMSPEASSPRLKASGTSDTVGQASFQQAPPLFYIGLRQTEGCQERSLHVPLTVHHYFPLGSENVGDHLVARAIRAAVARHFAHAGDVKFVDFPANDR